MDKSAWAAKIGQFVALYLSNATVCSSPFLLPCFAQKCVGATLTDASKPCLTRDHYYPECDASKSSTASM